MNGNELEEDKEKSPITVGKITMMQDGEVLGEVTGLNLNPVPTQAELMAEFDKTWPPIRAKQSEEADVVEADRTVSAVRLLADARQRLQQAKFTMKKSTLIQEAEEHLAKAKEPFLEAIRKAELQKKTAETELEKLWLIDGLGKTETIDWWKVTRRESMNLSILSVRSIYQAVKRLDDRSAVLAIKSWDTKHLKKLAEVGALPGGSFLLSSSSSFVLKERTCSEMEIVLLDEICHCDRNLVVRPSRPGEAGNPGKYCPVCDY